MSLYWSRTAATFKQNNREYVVATHWDERVDTKKKCRQWEWLVTSKGIIWEVYENQLEIWQILAGLSIWTLPLGQYVNSRGLGLLYCPWTCIEAEKRPLLNRASENVMFGYPFKWTEQIWKGVGKDNGCGWVQVKASGWFSKPRKGDFISQVL